MTRAYKLLDQLEYVRLRIIRALLYYVGGVVIGYILAPYVMGKIVGDGYVTNLIFLSPTEAFFSRFKLAFAVGLIPALPFIIAQLWGIIEPLLKQEHKRFASAFIAGSTLLFVGGVLFSFYAVLPFAFQFFLGFGTASGLSAEISVANYVSFVIGITLPFGLVFQLPIVVIFFSRTGIIQPETFRANRKYVVFGAFIVATLLTPPDVITQFMLAIPLVILYEISILLARKFASPSRRS